MLTKQQILNKLSANKQLLRDEFQVNKIALFGSYAKGTARPDSDVDILVDVDASIGLEFVTLAEKFEHLLNAKVDLVSARAVKPHYMQHIRPELIYV